MNESTKVGLAVIFITVMLLLAGTCDYTEEVICHMPAETYKAIKAELGNDASDYSIVREYKRNYKKWKN